MEPPRPSRVTARWQNAEAGASAVVYPQPHRDGFRDVLSPGFNHQERDRGTKVTEEFTLVVETANSTGWGPLKRRLLSTDADILLAQETWVLPNQKREASDWAARHGWESAWAPAQPGAGGGASGGVAVLARRGLGLRLPPVGSHIVEEARVVAAFCEPPGYRPILAVSAYLIDGKGTQLANKAILTRIGKCVEAQGVDCQALEGGDFQCRPTDVDGTGFPHMVRGRTVAPSSARGTYRSARGASTIDYFIISDELVDVVDSIRIVECSGLKGHSPVEVRFLPRAVAQKALAVRQPPTLPTDRVFGPIPPPQNWEEAQRVAERALAEARKDRDIKQTQALIDEAYLSWCSVAEVEVANATGTDPAKWGLRGRPPKMRWRSVLPERAPRGGQPLAAVASWLRGVAVELAQITKVINDDMGQGFFYDDAQRRSYMPHGTTFAAPVRGGYDRRQPDAAATRGGRPRPPTGTSEMMRVVSEIREDLGDEDGRVIDDDAVVDLWGQLVLTSARLGEALRQYSSTGIHTDMTLQNDIGRATDALTAVENKLEADRKTADRKGWEEWLEGDWNNGSRRAHKATRSPVEWRPTTTTDSKGVVTASPTALLEAYYCKYKNYWDASETPQDIHWEGACPELPPLTPDELRMASLAFPKSTSSTYDGWHVRHFSMICDAGLQALSTLLAAIERSARWPAQVTLTTMPLIDKPKGGHRTIGKLAALYRTWAKARRPLAAEWEVNNDRPFFAASAGIGPIDAVYKQALRQEAACANGEAAAVILEDMEAFYEGIDRDALIAEAQAVGFPMVLVRACLAAYAAPRMLTMNGVATREIYPRRGLIAGCTFATTLVKVFYLRKN